MNIVMYHFVRPPKVHNEFEMTGLSLDDFSKQVKYLRANFKFIGYDEIIERLYNRTPFSDEEVWLTFDDGYRDHFEYVLPILCENKIKAAFFPTTAPLIENTPLVINLIHITLSIYKNKKRELLQLIIRKLVTEYGISRDYLTMAISRIDTASRFDDRETIIIKRLLQQQISPDMARALTENIVQTHTGLSPINICELLYMTKSQLKSLAENQMTIGCHGHNHLWLEHSDYLTQVDDLSKSLEHLRATDFYSDSGILCYPFGSYNAETIEIAKKLKFKIGLTTKPGRNNGIVQDQLTLNRYDTNDFR